MILIFLFWIATILLFIYYPVAKRGPGWYGLQGFIISLLCLVILVDMLFSVISILGIVGVAVTGFVAYDHFKRAVQLDKKQREQEETK